jgi:hypothetical protein
MSCSLRAEYTTTSSAKAGKAQARAKNRAQKRFDFMRVMRLKKAMERFLIGTA